LVCGVGGGGGGGGSRLGMRLHVCVMRLRKAARAYLDTVIH